MSNPFVFVAFFKLLTDDIARLLPCILLLQGISYHAYYVLRYLIANMYALPRSAFIFSISKDHMLEYQDYNSSNDICMAWIRIDDYSLQNTFV